MQNRPGLWHSGVVWRLAPPAVLLGLVFALLLIASAAADVPSWSVALPEEANGTVSVAPDTTVFVGSCTDVARDGGLLWQLPAVLGQTPDCMDAVTDSEGNTYTLTNESTTGDSVVESLSPSGVVRWSVPVGEYTATALGRPVVGANGSVFFSLWNGQRSMLMGFNEQNGTITLQRQFDYVTGWHAYTGGLVVVNTDSQIIYLGYDGTELANYSTGLPISAYEAYSNASGAAGTIFVAGYEGSCGSGSHASVEKFTPTGLAWTWTDPATYCSQTDLAATPDGGVIFARSKMNPSADFTSLSATGTERWTDYMQGPIGPAQGAGYFPVRVDVNGVVVLPAKMLYRCPVQPSEECWGAQVELVSEQTGAMDYAPVQLQGPGEYGINPNSDAIGVERLYITGEVLEPSVDIPTLYAFSIPGLGEDYQVALQEQLMSPPPSGGGNPGSGESGGGNSGSLGNTEPDTYVSLGDSYSSGQGNPPYLQGTDTASDTCHRSGVAYAFDAANDLGFYGSHFSFHACNGAVIANFYNGHNDEPPQLNWLTSSDALVTLSVGGDDAYFAKVMASCVYGHNCENQWRGRVNRAIATMGHYSPKNNESLQRLYMEIATHAPNAKIVILGYPRFFPKHPPPHCLSELGPTINEAKMLWINSEIARMDQVVKAAVAGAHRVYPRVVYVEKSYSAFAGHELCTSSPDMFGVKASRHKEIVGGSFHPNLSGQSAFANLIEGIAQQG